MEKTINPGRKISGSVMIPGDKSISHRALIIAALAEGESKIENLNHGEDVLSTLRCLQSLGVHIKRQSSGVTVAGKGLDGLTAPRGDLDAGNSGTTMRLLSGILAGQKFSSMITGDASLRGRPMDRIVAPLRSMGARVMAAESSYPPLSFEAADLRGITYRMPVASAQVKSCLLLAGLYARGKTEIEEQNMTRDHTEILLRKFGCSIERENGRVSVAGFPKMTGRYIQIPGDFSAAVYFMAAALLVVEGELLLKNVGINPTRSAFLQILTDMGAAIDVINLREVDNELSADIFVRHSKLKGITIGGGMVSQVIDEIPILAVLASQANGVTEIRDGAELRVKESDRLSALTQNLTQMGVSVDERQDGLIITGPADLCGAQIESFRDHRIAMAFSVAGLVAAGETVIREAECVKISYPDFFDQLDSVTIG